MLKAALALRESKGSHWPLTLQTLPADAERSSAAVAANSGFSLHAGVAAKPEERLHLEFSQSAPTHRASMPAATPAATV
ncbi:MAG TPA: hypothetical protein VFY39_15975 [Gammaproteobacteria bacterium]|nr:hypothetical protein [Gammaproteobacteria bacterium]